MKSLIIYYSVSGNTHKIALAIHKGLQQSINKCDIMNIIGTKGVPGMHMAHLLEYDLIGIGFPVWNSTLPPNVLDFIILCLLSVKITFIRQVLKKTSQLKKENTVSFS